MHSTPYLNGHRQTSIVIHHLTDIGTALHSIELLLLTVMPMAITLLPLSWNASYPTAVHHHSQRSSHILFQLPCWLHTIFLYVFALPERQALILRVFLQARIHHPIPMIRASPCTTHSALVPISAAALLCSLHLLAVSVLPFFMSKFLSGCPRSCACACDQVHVKPSSLCSHSLCATTCGHTD